MPSPSVDLTRRFLNPKYADLHVRCGEKSFHIHRAVVCSASEVLAMEVDNNIIEANMRVIEHTRFDAATMDKMFQYLYRGDYTFDPADSMATIVPGDDTAIKALSLLSIDENASNEAVHRLASHVRVHAAAGHYELEDLEQLAVAKFSLERERFEPLSSRDLIAIVVVVDDHPSNAATELRREALGTALSNRKKYLASPEFLRSLLEQHELRAFASSFFEGVTSYHESELDNVVQDFSSEIHKLQRELHDVSCEKNAAYLDSKAHSSDVKSLWTIEKAELQRELVLSRTSRDIDLKEKEECHERVVRGLNSEKVKLKSELVAAQSRNDTLQARQLLHNATIASLERQKEILQTSGNASAENYQKMHQVVDQLVELNRSSQCRHCGYDFIYELERWGETGYLARCVVCRTRHFAGPNDGCI
ncbi:uncharacterized protein RCC_09648 [Ramularia collo-cygni]|uniref:BTB domain-containing protein n=1 Tax=Ramularia collo-cygni TaxID=112498 RepID=A0A2D3V7G5_9PEZI|nr:uncharacterized protein RCC_09648 [Ramularia collo-cygni]CZT23933.1 uncharacterized protein RCC_09648 [Ramularia collo-cygni]